MTIILAFMIVGIIAGTALGKYPSALKINDKLLTTTIYILLLLLGIAVGANSKIMHNLYIIGIQAIIITIGAITGSIFVCWLIYKSFFHLK